MTTESTATAAIATEPVSSDKIEDASAPSTSADKVESLDMYREAKKLLGLGQKNLVMGDIPAAVNAFQEAASLLEESEAAGDGLETKVAQRATKKSEEQMKEETEGSEEEDKDNDKAEEIPNESVVENKSLQENEEETGNLELAWDMLDLAKIIFKRQETREVQLCASQAHLKLGEVSVESENYIQAVEEFQACLNLQEQYLEAHDRLLLGLAYGYNSQYDEAVSQFNKSIEVIEKRMAVLNDQMKETEGSFTEYEKEIEELKELLPEIREKIEDAKESQHSGNVAELALKATLVESFSSSEGGSSVSTIAKKTENQAESHVAVEGTVEATATVESTAC
uniref:Nuclear autoantigenic sperm protein n=1 Tax=Jaculus jaculus TaxID=51337 RepID=A0A8C5NVW8_JACJA